MQSNRNSESEHTDFGCLYIVATPIGNLGDITARAIDTLNSVACIAAEDTRHSARLLQHFNITTPVLAYHDHSDERRTQQILARLQQGESVALISDAGTPLISDPGYALVKLAREQGISVSPIPGPCALIAALTVAGIPSDRFSFEGFLPAKVTARNALLQKLAKVTQTLIFYESPHRLLESLASLSQVFGPEREAVIAREITKTYETITRGTLGELLAMTQADSNQQKGEFVLIIRGCTKTAETQGITDEAETIMRVLLEELSTKQAAGLAAKLTGLKKRDLYQWALDNNPK